jgi:hypothetical protein
MPWTDFICPDGATIRIEDCIAKCRMDTGRCVAPPTLEMFRRGRRPWTGKLSTTSALNGTRLEYLKIRHDYAEAPCRRAFALLGTLHHTRYQKLDLPNALHEERLEDELSSGIFDYYANGEIYDFKTAGCWKVCRALGKFQVEEDTGEVFKSGPRKGLPKMRKVWTLGEPDYFDWRMQGSRYAWMLMDTGFPVERYIVQVTVRDFTRMTARMYGLERQIYLIDIPLFDRDTVVNYYRAKQEAIDQALRLDTVPEPCSPTERWDDKRCREYCPVSGFCDYAQNLPKEGDSDE